MGSGAVIAIVAALVAALLWFFRSRAKPWPKVAVHQIPAVTAQLEAARHDASWVVFFFTPRNEADGDDNGVALQYSLIDGRLGLDWVLLQPRNITDKEKIVGSARLRNQVVVEREDNGVHSLRVEDGDIVGLGVQIVKELYRLDDDDAMELYSDNFDWKP